MIWTIYSNNLPLYVFKIPTIFMKNAIFKINLTETAYLSIFVLFVDFDAKILQNIF